MIKIGQIGIGHNHGEAKMLAVRKFPELFEVVGYAEENEEWIKKRGGRYGMTMCMNIAKTVGMSEEDIFRAITSTPAKVLVKETELGYLKEGRCADISVFDYTDEGFDLTDSAGNQIKSDMGYRCVLTIVDGQVVFRA